jgi:hypothetical protein
MRVDTLSSFWVWWSLACICWVWMLVSNIRSGGLGWTFLRVERATQPTKFWAFFAIQNGLVLVMFIYLAGLIDGVR